MYVFIVCMYFLTINQQRTLELIFKAKKKQESELQNQDRNQDFEMASRYQD